MTGRHKYTPEHLPSQTDGEDISPYGYAAQLRLHHEMAISGWDKPAGQHKRETESTQPSSLRSKNRRKTGAIAILETITHPPLGY